MLIYFISKHPGICVYRYTETPLTASNLHITIPTHHFHNLQSLRVCLCITHCAFSSLYPPVRLEWTINCLGISFIIYICSFIMFVDTLHLKQTSKMKIYVFDEFRSRLRIWFYLFAQLYTYYQIIGTVGIPKIYHIWKRYIKYVPNIPIIHLFGWTRTASNICVFLWDVVL